MNEIEAVINVLLENRNKWQKPIVSEIAENNKDPYRILITTVLSLRTKDDVTRDASQRLFLLADSPDTMMNLDRSDIEKAIFPVGFYHNKAVTIIDISRTITEKYNGIVPDEIDELLTLKGVGRKTANLVVTVGYNKPGICVDTHVHRISNRLGYVSTKNPVETEFVLRKKLPERYWIDYNDLLVTFGQNVCKPISPLCSQCLIHAYCQRVGVKIHR